MLKVWQHTFGNDRAQEAQNQSPEVSIDQKWPVWNLQTCYKECWQLIQSLPLAFVGLHHY